MYGAIRFMARKQTAVYQF